MEENVTSSKKKKKEQLRKNQYVTVELVLPDKSQISKDIGRSPHTFGGKYNSCRNDTQNTELSPILVPALITKEKVLKPWWNSQKKEESKKLLLHTEIDYPDSHSNSLNGFFQNMESDSWFSIKKWIPVEKPNCVKTSSLSSQSFRVESTEKENTKLERTRVSSKTKTKETAVNSSRKVRLYPNNKQKNCISQMVGCYRKTWNLALNGIKNEGLNINAIELRNKYVTNKNLPEDLKYLSKVPCHVRECAIFELVNAYKIEFNKQELDKNHKFDIKYKSKKHDKSIGIPKQALSWKDNKLSLCPMFLKSTIKCFNSLNKRTIGQKEEIKHECRLVLDSIGRYYLHIPISVNEDIIENQDDKICSLDAGVRTFHTLFCSNGDAIKFGDNDFDKLAKMCIISDRIQSQYDKCSNKRKKRMYKKAFLKNNLKIRHLVDEVHWKVIKYITDNYKEVILPPFEVSNMTKRLKRQIRSKTPTSVRGLWPM